MTSAIKKLSVRSYVEFPQKDNRLHCKILPCKKYIEINWLQDVNIIQRTA